MTGKKYNTSNIYTVNDIAEAVRCPLGELDVVVLHESLSDFQDCSWNSLELRRQNLVI